MQAITSGSAKPKGEEGLAQGQPERLWFSQAGSVLGEAYGEYLMNLGLAGETIYCCEAAESKGLYKVGCR